MIYQGLIMIYQGWLWSTKIDYNLPRLIMIYDIDHDPARLRPTEVDYDQPG